ncbi:hypothetical protein TNCV_2462191 [Trichonephila clavipes]|nr:hypothetical protein TNCV_2462191 [Trichonephila clavipes]
MSLIQISSVFFKVALSNTRNTGNGPRTLNHDQVTRATPELEPHTPNFHTMPTRELQATPNLTCIHPFIGLIFSGTNPSHAGHKSMTTRLS